LEDTKREISDQPGNAGAQVFVADLAALGEVRRLAVEVEEATGRLDALVNNAGIGGLAQRRLSRDGYEVQFAVNYLATFLLTALLITLLRRSAPARIVNVTSSGQHAIDFANVMLDTDYETVRAYRQSKFAQILFTIELAQRIEQSNLGGIAVNALHPATRMGTKLDTNWWGPPMSTVEEGVEALFYLTTSPSLEGITGRYFEGNVESTPLQQALDPLAREHLWKLSEQLTGVTFDLEHDPIAPLS
jgi:NAD(P)-dependent dehydrogenase (short-subunit alcohol dehydrogenase family)